MDSRPDTETCRTEDAVPACDFISREVLEELGLLVQELIEEAVCYHEALNSGSNRPHRQPWGETATTASIAIPSHFPDGIIRMINHLPLMGELESIGRNIKQLIIDFIDAMFSPGTPENILRLRQLASFFDLIPKEILQDLTYSISVFVEMCFYYPSGSHFCVGEFLHYHTSLHPSRFIPWMGSLQSTTLQSAFKIPGIRIDHLRHLLKHMRINVKPAPEVKFTITITSCNDELYTPAATEKDETRISSIQRFINSLPNIPIDYLEDDYRTCPICRVDYGKPGSLLDSLPESVLQLPCNHTFGKGCLSVLLKPQYVGGWNWRSCPLCRREIGISESSGPCLLPIMWYDDGRL